MKQELTEIFTVNKNDCISDISVDLPDLLGTYILVKWMEIVSAKLALDTIDERYITVGQSIDIKHTEMAIQGNRISIQSTIKRKEKRKLLFSIVAKLNDIQIAEAEHTRIIISKKILNRQFKL